MRIDVSGDFRTAHYTYDYTIEPGQDFDGTWRDVFAYPLKEVRNVIVQVGQNAGPKWELSALNTPESNACLAIVLDGAYQFSYSLDTKIESFAHTTPFAGEGCIAYWTASEYPCDSLEVSINLPSGVKIIDVHPNPRLRSKPTSVSFTTRSRIPMEFFIAFLTFQKTFLGMKPRTVRFLSQLVWTLGSLAAGYILKEIL